jgi:putative ABC transport system permease protein
MPDWRAELRTRLAGVRVAPARAAAIVDELSQHLEDRERDLIASGVPPDEATKLTRAELDRADLLAPRLAALQQRRWHSPPSPGAAAHGRFSGLANDLRYAWRTLCHDPLTAIVAVLTLAFGIGLNTAMFGFMNALLLRPLPFPDADRLMRLYRTTADNNAGGFSPADYLALRQAESGIGRFAAYTPSALTLSERHRSAEWMQVSANLFDVLGIHPVRGRSFQPDDDLAGSPRVVLISTAFWQGYFAGAPDVIGRTVRAEDGDYEVIGVLPPAASDHRLFARIGLFSPLRLDALAHIDRTTHALIPIGRRDASVSEAESQAFIAALGARRAHDYPRDDARTGWRSEALPDSNTGPTGRALLAMLLGLSAFVLLIACSNLANLLLARAIDRTREFAVRTALGASRSQLIRTIVLESLLLAAAGGTLALLVATWTMRWLQSMVVDGGGPQIPMDWRVFGFAGAASLTTVLLCAAAPALFARGVSVGGSLKSGGRGATTGRGQVRFRIMLIGAQFALAMVVVAGALFFQRGTRQLVSQHYGWNADRVVQGEFVLPAERYASNADISAFQRRALERLNRVAGIEAASLSYGLPYMGLRGTAHYIGDADRRSPATAKINGISPAYFDVTGTRVIAGRPFTDEDTATARPVTIISEGLARQLFPGSNPIGRRVAAAGADVPVWMEVVGVAADVRPIDFAQDPTSFQLYQPTLQDPRRHMILAVRSRDVASEAVGVAIKAAMAELDPDLSVRRLMTATGRMGEVTTAMSLMSQLLTAFAALGLFLAALGIYGAMTRMVAQRTDEIGVRMALGAQVGNVLGMILGSGLRVVAGGAACGLAGAVALSRALGAVLPGMTTSDSSVVWAAGLLMAVGLVACMVPARHATRVDPLIAMRSE